MIYEVEMNEWRCGLYSGAGNLLTFVSFCDKNTEVWVICGAGYSLENMVHAVVYHSQSLLAFKLLQILEMWIEMKSCIALKTKIT